MQKALRKNGLVIIFILLLCVIGISMAALPFRGYAFANENASEEFEQKVYCRTSIDEDFDDSCVLVVLDKYHSGVNKKIDDNLFGHLPITAIKDLMFIESKVEELQLLNTDDFRQILRLEIAEPSKENVLNIVHEIEQIEGVLSASPSHYLTSYTLPTCATGELYPDLWGLHGTYGIHADEAWDITTGSQSVRVGIIDTGVMAHDDLVGNLVEGWNTINEETEQLDNVGHGTHIAGTIGATGTNEDGIVGVANEVSIVPIQVGVGFPLPNLVIPLIREDFCVAGVEWAIENNIDIINFSLGSYSEVLALKTAISNYLGLFVCAAGNGVQSDGEYVGVDTDTTPNYPSCYTSGQDFSNRVISVGAINANGERTSFSNYGATTVDIFAPGDSILSTVPESVSSAGYAIFSGTSMATPHVVGTAALLYSEYISNPYNMTRSDIASTIKSIIKSNATYDSNLSGYCVSGGRLNAYECLYNIPYRRVMSGFGYNASWYKWYGKVDLNIVRADSFYMNSSEQIVFTKTTDLNFAVGTNSAYNAWKEITGTLTFELKNSSEEIVQINEEDYFTSSIRVGLVSNVEYTNRFFTLNTGDLSNDTYTLNMSSRVSRDGTYYTHSREFTFVVSRSSCVAEGSLITLADGMQTAVESLTGNENLLVWNMLTGSFDYAPILFIDSDPSRMYEVINLTFSDGTMVKVIDEHAFWDFDLNEYVFLRSDAARYIGHYFNKQATDGNGNMIYTAVQLTGVNIVQEYTTAWSPVTFGHLCYYVNGMLSMPGATEGLINIFEVDPVTMSYDAEAMAADIAEYGLFTYEEFSAIFDIPEVIFQAFGGQYLKVAIGKGLLTYEDIARLIERYSNEF